MHVSWASSLHERLRKFWHVLRLVANICFLHILLLKHSVLVCWIRLGHAELFVGRKPFWDTKARTCDLACAQIFATLRQDFLVHVLGVVSRFIRNHRCLKFLVLLYRLWKLVVISLMGTIRHQWAVKSVVDGVALQGAHIVHAVSDYDLELLLCRLVLLGELLALVMGVRQVKLHFIALHFELHQLLSQKLFVLPHFIPLKR